MPAATDCAIAGCFTQTCGAGECGSASIATEPVSAMCLREVTGDVRDTLKKLKENGIKLAVGSSSKNTAFILEKTDLTDAFDAVAGKKSERVYAEIIDN